jgi:hypothetical protein
LNIVKTTKIYESTVPITEVGGSFSDLSLWVFWRENGSLKAKYIPKANVLDVNGLYIGSLADVEWSEVALLSNNTDDHYPVLFTTSDNSGLLVWGRAGELLIMPEAVLKDLLSGNFKYRYSADVSPVAPLAKLGNVAKVVATWDDSEDTTRTYLLFTRANDETSWTAVEKGAVIPNADASNILHLRMIMYSTVADEYSVPALDQLKLIYCSSHYGGHWEDDTVVSLAWKE